MYVIGTAGHVDHGKSTLVKALTGIDPDRLAEEQARQMTIDLGFAWMQLPGGQEIGIVDVPGHRDFIDNMLAGVGGIDAALLVIAADEGVMPQTREHLAILDLLDVSRAIIALTKTDLVEDPAWMELVKDEIAQLAKGTRLEQAPILPVSAATGEGLDELVAAMAKMLNQLPAHMDRARPRLPIDRAFTMSGFGTVVTGTLMDGSLTTGQEIEILPGGFSGRVRGMQTHKTGLERAGPGRRLAVNISGINVGDVQRGDVLCTVGTYRPTKLVDVHVRVLKDVSKPLRHNQTAKLFLGTAQRQARIRILGSETLQAGEEGWLQLVLLEPVVAERGDRFILRRPSPGETLGGGQVADAHPIRRHRRHDRVVIERLEAAWRGAPSDLLLQAFDQLGPAGLVRAAAKAGLTVQQAKLAQAESIEQGMLSELDSQAGSPGEGLMVTAAWWVGFCDRLEGMLETHHRQNPLQLGMPRQEAMGRLGIDPRLFALLLERLILEGRLELQAGRLSLPGFRVSLSAKQQQQVDQVMARFERDRASAPSVKEVVAITGEPLYRYLLDSDRLKQLSPDVVLNQDSYEQMVEIVIQQLKDAGEVGVAEVRDRLNTSRKYALALMEHLDAIGVTRRVGDVRRLKSPETS
jgi:selenocysteine-specific elongation factor